MKTPDEWMEKFGRVNMPRLHDQPEIVSILTIEEIKEIQDDATRTHSQKIEELQSEIKTLKQIRNPDGTAKTIVDQQDKIASLERELEARQSKAQEYCDDINKLLLEKDKLRVERDSLQQEVERLKEENEALDTECLNREIARNQLAKQNKVMEEALKGYNKIVSIILSEGGTKIDKWWEPLIDTQQTGRRVIHDWPTTNLHVLTTEEYRKVIEGMPCKCYGFQFHHKEAIGDYVPNPEFIQCPRCKRLDELK